MLILLIYVLSIKIVAANNVLGIANKIYTPIHCSK